jgi:phage terminase small subunit
LLSRHVRRFGQYTDGANDAARFVSYERLTSRSVHHGTDRVHEIGESAHVLAGLDVRGCRDPFVTNPAWRIYRDAAKAQLVLAREFGLTPSARSLLAAHEEEGSDE